MTISKAAWQWVVCGWYLFFYASEVCIDPFIFVYMQSQGLSEEQIGLIAALRPWIGVVATFVWGLAADYFKAHRTFVITLLLASSAVLLPLPIVTSFQHLLLLTLANRVLGSPVTVMADAAVTRSCTREGEYGGYRLYGAIGWGGMSTLAGLLSDAYGIQASLAANLALMVPCAVLSWFLCRPAGAETTDTTVSKQMQARHACKLSTSNSDYSSLLGLAGASVTADRRKGGGDAGYDIELLQVTHHGSDRHRPEAEPRRGRGPWPGVDFSHCAGERARVSDRGKAPQSGERCAAGGPLDAPPRDAARGIAPQQGAVTDACSDRSAAPSHAATAPHEDAGPLSNCVEGAARDVHVPSHCMGAHAVAGGPVLTTSDNDEVWLLKKRQGAHATASPALCARSSSTCAASSAAATSAGDPLGVDRVDRGQLPFSTKLWLIFSRPECLVFFWTTTVMGFGMGMIDSFLFLLLKDMGAADALLGLAMTITCVVEVPVFKLQGLVLKHLGSPDALMDVSLAAYTIRMLCYALLPVLGSPWWVMPVEVLHGVAFACGWGAGCEKSKALAPPGLEATQQGIFQSLYFGLGAGLGALVGGPLAQRYGFQTMFLYGGMTVAVGWLLSLLARLTLVPLAALSRAGGGVTYIAVAVVEV